MFPRDEVAGCLSGIWHHSRHNQFWRWRKVVPVWGGLNSSNSYSTEIPWSKRIDSRGPWIKCLFSWCHDAAAKRRADSNYVCPVRKLLKKRVFGGFSSIWCCPEKGSGMNRISHPDWVKIFIDPNGQIKLRAKTKIRSSFCYKLYQRLKKIQRKNFSIHYTSV